MRIEPIRILKSLAFALATLAATGVLVAAGLNEGTPVKAGAANTASPAN